MSGAATATTAERESSAAALSGAKLDTNHPYRDIRIVSICLRSIQAREDMLWVCEALCSVCRTEARVGSERAAGIAATSPRACM